jgi:hypothetical protein
MSSPLLKQKNKKKTKILSTDQAIRFLKKHFNDLGYGGMKNFCEKHKTINYSTLNSIINHKPNNKNVPIKKIPVIFEAIGYECELKKTIEFHITENT